MRVEFYDPNPQAVDDTEPVLRIPEATIYLIIDPSDKTFRLTHPNDLASIIDLYDDAPLRILPIMQETLDEGIGWLNLAPLLVEDELKVFDLCDL